MAKWNLGRTCLHELPVGLDQFSGVDKSQYWPQRRVISLNIGLQGYNTNIPIQHMCIYGLGGSCWRLLLHSGFFRLGSVACEVYSSGDHCWIQIFARAIFSGVYVCMYGCMYVCRIHRSICRSVCRIHRYMFFVLNDLAHQVSNFQFLFLKGNNEMFANTSLALSNRL